MSYKKFTKDVLIFGITQLVTMLRGFIVVPIITKLLGTQSYGIWAQLMVTISLLTPITIVGVQYSIVRLLPGQKDKDGVSNDVWSIFLFILGVSLILSVVMFIFSGPISTILGGGKTIIQLLSIIIVLECLNQVLSNTFRALQKIKQYSFFVIMQTVVEAFLVFMAIYSGYGLLGAVISLLIARLINFIVMGLIIIKKIGVKVPDFKRLKEYLSFGSPYIITDLSFWVAQSSDKYIIGLFMGTLFVGYYAPAYTLGSCIFLFTSTLNFILPATLSKHFDDNNINEVKTYLKYSLKYLLAICIPAVFGLTVLSKQLLRMFSNADIAQHSYYVVPFVALSITLFGISSVIGQAIMLKKKVKLNATIWLCAALLNLGLNLVFVPFLGILGAAVTTLLAYILVLSLTLLYSSKDLSVTLDWKFILKSIMSSALMFLIILIFNPSNFIQTVFAIILGGLIYSFLVFIFKGFSKDEILFMKDLLKA